MITNAVTAIIIMVISIVGVTTGNVDIEYVNGSLVVGSGLPMFQLNGAMIGGYSEHEYMHYNQQQAIGDVVYYSCVAIPSVLTNMIAFSTYVISGVYMSYDYHSLPWETKDFSSAF